MLFFPGGLRVCDHGHSQGMGLHHPSSHTGFWQGNVVWRLPPVSWSQVTLNMELGLGEAQDTIKFSNLTQTTLPGAAMLDLEGLEQS